MVAAAPGRLVPAGRRGPRGPGVGGRRHRHADGRLRRAHARHVRRRRGRPRPPLRRLLSRSSRGWSRARRVADRRGVPARRRDAAEPEPRRRLLRRAAGRAPRRRRRRAAAARATRGRPRARALSPGRSRPGRAAEDLPGDGQAARARWGRRLAVVVAGRVVFLCCEGCEGALKANPEKYLAEARRPAGPRP